MLSVTFTESREADMLHFVTQRLQDPRFDSPTHINKLIRLVTGCGCLSAIELLLSDKRVDPSADNNCAIRGAVSGGHIAVVERLLQDERVDPSSNDNCVIHLVAKCGRVALLDRLLLDPRVDPAANENRAVLWAAVHGQYAVVDRLLEDDRVDGAVAIRCIGAVRFEYRERLTEICIALQDMQLPAWVTLQILDAARPYSTLQLHSKWALVCAVKHFHS
jgi:Ankyrin repeats (3 copies)